MTDRQHPEAEHEYVLGTDRDELVRLGFQHQVWRGEAAAGWEAGGFGPGKALLDVGCGPGYATFDLAQLVGSRGRVHGVDASARFVAELRAQAEGRGLANVSAEVGDVERLPLAAASFDGAYARWVLFVVSDPDAVVASVGRALRTGGTFVVHDYCHYEGAFVSPPAPVFARGFRAVAESIRAHGGDPDVGAALPAMMRRHGLEPRSVRPIQRIARPGTALWKWPETFFDNYFPSLVESGLLTEAERAEFMDGWHRRANDPASFFWTPPMIEIVGVKG
ncbi:MAG TPA: methyltransferase domain-containing protein [Longimicrobiaceae bacterium]|jgi:SAM-dependent methyltransferase|nr:methyltransferase domain-containing protein [Longimicrobiaceae bacterium]